MKLDRERFFDFASTIVEITALIKPPKKVWQKADRSLVTDVDLSFEKEILRILKRDWLGIPVMSEETQRDTDLSGGDFAWVIDPCDGTSDLAANRPQECSILLGLLDLEKGIPSAGIVVQPWLQKPKALACFGTIRSWDYDSRKWVPFVRTPSDWPEIGLDLSGDSTPEYWSRAQRLVRALNGRVVNLPAGASQIGVIEGSLSCVVADNHQPRGRVATPPLIH